jgi:hypothetical protein
MSIIKKVIDIFYTQSIEFNCYMKTISLLLIILLIQESLLSQQTFSVLISTPDDERIFDGTEGKYGNFYFVGKKNTSNFFSESSYFLALNKFGDIIYQQDFIIEDTVSYFGSVHYMNDSIIIFGGKGPLSSGVSNILRVLILDTNYHVLKDKSYSLSGYNIVDLETLVNRNGNYILTGVINYPDEMPDMLFYEFSSSGDSVNCNVLSFDGGQFEYDLIEKETGGYKVFAYGDFLGAPQSWGKIIDIDESFNFLCADSIPYSLFYNHSAKWINNSSYLITGNKLIEAENDRVDIGIIKLTKNDSLIIGKHYGKSGDTLNYVGACSNLDFISSEKIYFGGVSNFYPEYQLFQPEDCWLLLNELDTNLNLNWQKYYGGDAAYYLWGLKATNDGGCLLMATRYDADIQDHELDIYILKVDSNGLLTSTGEGPQIPVQQLAIIPNPALDNVSIRYPNIFGYDDKEIEIYNSQGLPVITQSAIQDLPETRLNVSSLPAGLYYVLLKVEGNKVATGKMVKI